MTLGTIFNIPVEPIKVENTQFVEAGPIRLAVEYREINSDSLRKSFSINDEMAEGLEAVLGDRDVSDRGVSIHVIGVENDHEYLRFDCFDDGPHYHYLPLTRPNENIINQRVFFDESACGPMLPWTITCLRTRLPEMLRQAQGDELIAALDDDTIQRALDEVETLARHAFETY